MNRILQIKISIKHIEPPIWREFLVKGKITLRKLHQIIQLSFGWDNLKPYQFIYKKQIIGNPSLLPDVKMYDDQDIYLSALLENVDDKLQYTYGPAKEWRLTILLEKLLEDHNTLRVTRCIGGERNAPPINFERPSEYIKFLQSKENSKNGSQIIKESYDPEFIDFSKINFALEDAELEVEDE